MRGLPTIVFDLDGTLVDSAPDLTAALNHVMTESGCGRFTIGEVRNLVGRGARVLIERGLRHHGRDPAPIEVDRLLGLFLEYYGSHLADETKPFAGVPEILEIFSRRGTRLAVCTNKSEDLSRKLLRLLDLDRYFPVVLGGDSLPVRKPDPLHLTETIRRAGGEIENALMIGDSTSDVGAARSAAIPVIAVSFGYHDRPVRDLGADLIINHFDELPAAAARLVSGFLSR